MLQRGLRRRFDPLVEREAREADAVRRGPRATCATLPTFTIDPPTARDFDDAISAEELDDGAVRVWVHIADVSAFVPAGSAVDREAFRRGDVACTCPGWWSRCCPRRCPTARARWCPGQDRLAVTVELEFEGAQVRRTAFHRSRDPLRRAARLPAVDAMFAGGEPAAEPGRRRWRPRGGAARARASARRAARWRWSRPSPSSTSPRRARRARRAGRADRVARLIEYLMIAANEAVARPAGDAQARRRCTACTSRPDPARVERLLDQLASLGLPDAAGARAHDGASRRASSWRGRGWRARSAARRPGLHVADPALAQAGALLRRATSATSACARRATATSRRRSAAIPT